MVVDGIVIPGVVIGPDSPCVHDWTKCKNADDLLKHDFGHRNIKNGCEYSAWLALDVTYCKIGKTLDKLPPSCPSRESQGKPWPFPFKWDGVDYHHDGIIVLVSKDDSFSDQSMGGDVTCTFNLRANSMPGGFGTVT